jgi:CelD/BcsL family acetyltransferase involved in cellulose biosynthesis
MTLATLDLPEPATATGRWWLATLEDSAELEKLAPTWRNLAEAFGPTEQFAWATSCLATLDTDRPLRVVTLDRNDRCVGLAPMILRRVRGVRRLALVGLGDLHEPMDLLSSDDDALNRLTAAVIGRREPILFDRMPADSPTLLALEQRCRGRAIFVRRSAANCPYITLDDSWLDPAAHLNSGRRSDLRRARRKAEQSGPVSIDILSPEPADVDRLFDKAMAIEAKSWKGAARTALAYDNRRAEFFRHYIHQAAREGVLRICFLHIGDQPAAMQIAIEQRDAFWLLKIGYDANFSSASPGLLLMQETIRHAASAGLASYEFLGRAEAWTTVWTSQERETATVRIYPFTACGFSSLAVDTLAIGWRKLLAVGRKAADRLKKLASEPRAKMQSSLPRGPVPLFSGLAEPQTHGTS